MNLTDRPSITVLGGGPAGLAAGYYARREGLDVQIYEADDRVGGNARTLQRGPFRFDTGAHRLHDRIPHVTAEVKKLLGDELLHVEAPSQIYWQDRLVDFPLSPYDLVRKVDTRTLLRAAADKLRMLFQVHSAPDSFAEMARQAYGDTLAELFLLNYSEKLWGVSTDRLSTRAAGGRLEGLDLKTFLLEALLGKQAKTEHLDGSFYYPKYGFGSIVEAVAEAIGPPHIRCGARITELRHDGRRLRQVIINDDEVVEVEQVISTLPVPIMMRLLTPAPPPALQRQIERLRFRSLRLGVVGLDRPRLSDNASLYFPSREWPFTRIYEPKNRSPYMAPAQQTALVVEVPCDNADAHWKMDDEVFGQLMRTALTQTQLISEDEVLFVETHRLPHAYPVLEVGIGETMQRLIRYMESFANLHLVGRGARFEYVHTHDLFDDGRAVVRQLAAKGRPVETT